MQQDHLRSSISPNPRNLKEKLLVSTSWHNLRNHFTNFSLSLPLFPSPSLSLSNTDHNNSYRALLLASKGNTRKDWLKPASNPRNQCPISSVQCAVCSLCKLLLFLKGLFFPKIFFVAGWSAFEVHLTKVGTSEFFLATESLSQPVTVVPSGNAPTRVSPSLTLSPKKIHWLEPLILPRTYNCHCFSHP
jgi:hypothetical protein